MRLRPCWNSRPGAWTRPFLGAEANSLRQWHAARSRLRAAGTHGRRSAISGWDTLGNGELLDAAEAAGFDVLITTDRNLPYQQNLKVARSQSSPSARNKGPGTSRSH